MAQFYVTAQGNRGGVSRCGTKSSGVQSHTRGWNSGVEVYGDYDYDAEQDVFRIYATSGSNGHSSSKLIAIIRNGEIEIQPC